MSKNANQEALQLFQTKAEAVSCVVREVATKAEALEYVIDLCGNKEACQLLISGCEQALSEKAEGLGDAKQAKVVAAPNLMKKDFGTLKTLCNENGFVCLDKGLRDHLAGVDVGFAVVDAGIAETGTVVLKSDSEELRLASMISEVFVALLDKKAIYDDAFAAEETLAKVMSGDQSYTAFITGPSRTADIERVLALGVHGPLEMHVLLLG